MDPKTPASPPSPVQPASAPPVSATPSAAVLGALGTVDPSATAAATSSALAGSAEPTMSGASAENRNTTGLESTDASRLRAGVATSPSPREAGLALGLGAPNDAMCALLAQNWWAMALRGMFALLFGLVALFAPGPTLLSLALLFGAYLLVDGVFGIIAAVRAARRDERWGLLLIEGLANIVMGLVAVVFPVSAVVAFVLVTAAWALLTGGLMAAAAFRLDGNHGRWWLALSGGVSVVFGVMLLVSPLVGAVVLTWWLGAYALVFGAMLLGLAFKLRGRRGTSSTPSGVTPAAATR